MPTFYDENCLRIGPQDFLADQNPQPFFNEGALMLPASHVKAGLTSTEEGGSEFVSIMLSASVAGLFVSYTTEGARMFAAKLIEMADQADIAVAAAATAAIDKAKGK